MSTYRILAIFFAVFAVLLSANVRAQNIELIDLIAGKFVSIYVSNGYAYLSSTNGEFIIFDVSDPKAIKIQSEISFGSQYSGGPSDTIIGAGNYIIVKSSGAAYIIDVVDKTKANIVGTYIPQRNDGFLISVAVQGQYLYSLEGWGQQGVAESCCETKVVSLSNPANPTVVGQVQRGIGLSARPPMVIVGTNLYVPGEIIDVSDPKDPQILEKRWYAQGQIAELIAHNGYLYASLSGGEIDGHSGLEIFSIGGSDSVPVSEGILVTPDPVSRFAVEGKYAYFINGNARLWMVDISVPSQPGEADTYDINVPSSLWGSFTDIGVSNGYVLATHLTQGLYVFQTTESKSSISGTVTDSEGEPIAGVVVSAGTDHQSTTDSYGKYLLTGLAAGTYGIRAHKTGNVLTPTEHVVTVPRGSGESVDFIARPMPTPFLDLPVDYSDTSFARSAQGNVSNNGGRVNSWFDHTYPTYENGNTTRIWNRTEIRGEKETSVISCAKYNRNGCYDGHDGIDFSRNRDSNTNAFISTPILAAYSGIVTKTVTWCIEGTEKENTTCPGPNWLGNQVWIDHRNGFATVYGHLAEGAISVHDGDPVASRAELALMGNTGNSGGTHLHFGLYYDKNGNRDWERDEVVDPYGWWLFPDETDHEPWFEQVAEGGVPFPDQLEYLYLWKYEINSGISFDELGGTLSSASGNVTVDSPPGAVSTPIMLELWDAPPASEPSASLRSIGLPFWIRVSDLLAQQNSSGSSIVTATDGYVFSTPITISVAYSETNLVHLDEDRLVLYHWNEESAAWIALPSLVDQTQKQVIAHTTKVGSFDLQAPLRCPADTQEYDDDHYTASSIFVEDAPTTHLFDSPEDTDWFKWEATSWKTYLIQTSDLAPGVDTVLELYSLDGLTLLSSDDSSGERASKLIWQAPRGGTYFFRVAQASGSTFGCDAKYTVNISTTQGAAGGNLFLPFVQH